MVVYPQRQGFRHHLPYETSVHDGGFAQNGKLLSDECKNYAEKQISAITL
jgi:hypothetical protein